MKKTVVTVFALLCFGFAKAQFSGGNNAGYNSSSVNAYVTLNNCSVTGINALGNYNVTFKVYPNPTQGFVKGKCSENDKGSELRIVNVIGIEVYRTTITETSFTIDMNGFANGIYFAEFTNSNKTKYTQKIIKE